MDTKVNKKQRRVIWTKAIKERIGFDMEFCDSCAMAVGAAISGLPYSGHFYMYRGWTADIERIGKFFGIDKETAIKIYAYKTKFSASQIAEYILSL